MMFKKSYLLTDIIHEVDIDENTVFTVETMIEYDPIKNDIQVIHDHELDFYCNKRIVYSIYDLQSLKSLHQIWNIENIRPIDFNKV